MDTIPTREIAPLKGCREAETIFHGVLDERFGVDGAAAEMQVEIASLGKVLQEVAQSERVLLCLIEGADGALLGGAGGLRTERRDVRKTSDKQQRDDAATADRRS